MPNVRDYKKIPITVYLTKDQKKAVDWIRTGSGIPAAEVIRRAIDRELKRHKIPKSFAKKLENVEVPVERSDAVAQD